MNQGIHALGGVFFRIGDKLVHVRAQSAPGLPDTVSAIAVGARADKVQILHAARGDVKPGTQVGVYTVRYTNGTSERVPIVLGRNVGAWSSPERGPLVIPTDARCSWTGSNDRTDRMLVNRIKIHLYGFTWTNPHPQHTIATIDVTSMTGQSALVLVGITLEREKSQ
jgi:hypothetical protein